MRDGIENPTNPSPERQRAGANTNDPFSTRTHGLCWSRPAPAIHTMDLP